MVLFYVSNVGSSLNLYMFIVFISLGKILIFFSNTFYPPFVSFLKLKLCVQFDTVPLVTGAVLFFSTFLFLPLCVLFQIFFFFFFAVSSGSYIFSFAESNMLLIQSSEFFI